MRFKFSFLRLFCILLLVLSNFSYAGTDDTGLQVYTIKGEDMMGTTMEPNTEGLKYGQGMQNMYQTGNGLSTFYTGGTIYRSLSSVTNSKILDADSCYTPQYGANSLYYSYYCGTSTININLTNSKFSSTLKKFSYTDTIGGGLGLSSSWSFLRVFKDPFDSNKIYIFTPNHIFTDVYSGATAEVTFPFASNLLTDCEYFKNRIFCGASNGYLYYSSALVLSDFTNEASKGGTIKFPSPVTNVESTQFGLYVFTKSSVYLLSGADQPSSWKVEEVIPGRTNYVGLNNRSHDTVFERNNVVYFLGDVNDYQGSCDMFLLSGYSYKKIATVPLDSYSYYIGLSMLGENILCWYNGTNCSLLNINTGDLSIRTDITNGLNAYNFYCNSTYGTTWSYNIYWKQPLIYSYKTGDTYITAQKQFWYKTPIINFGNPSSYKEISRIEIDYIFAKNFSGGSAKCELNFYYPYVNILWTNSTSPAISENDTDIISSNVIKVPYRTFVWNAPAKVPVKRCYIDFRSNASMTSAYAGFQQSLLKEIRIFYRDLGAYKK